MRLRRSRSSGRPQRHHKVRPVRASPQATVPQPDALPAELAIPRPGGSQSGGSLRTVSLRARVTVLTLLVVAVVLVLVAVLTGVLFAVESRADLRSGLPVRATLAQELVTRHVGWEQVARRVEAPGVSASIVAPDGAVYGAGTEDSPPAGAVVLRRALSGGAQLTLVATDDAVTAAQQRLQRTLMLLSVGALVVAGIVTLLTTRLALRPLDTMTALARSITRGDRGRRLAPSRTGTELGRTAAAFDDMLDALEGAERSARTAEAAARAAEGAARESETRTRASEARMQRFVADAAHELRTPLAGVQAVAAAAIRPGLDPDERDRMHLLLMRETGRAAKLVDDLLALARVDAGIELHPQPVDLLQLAGGEAERIRFLAPDREVTVTGDTIVVTGDIARLGQVLSNLLDNALRYTPAGSPVAIEVAAHPTAGGAVRVVDSGPGVPAADRERIFDRLVRLDTARGGGDDGGAGLGLALARGLARAHGGELACIPPPSGAGAVFELTLPRTEVDPR